MSYALPILDSNGNTPRYGGEFQILYDAQLRGDQQNPVTVERDYNTGQKFTLYEPDGVYNQSLIFENNDDPDEDQQYTYGQSVQRILNNSNSNRPMTKDEKINSLYTDESFDPRFRQELVNESIKNKSNIFSTMSQDFVREVQESNLNYERNENLYRLNPSVQGQYNQLLNLGQRKMFSDPLNTGLSGLFQMAKEQQKTQAKQQKARTRFEGAKYNTETLGEKFKKSTAGLY